MNAPSSPSIGATACAYRCATHGRVQRFTIAACLVLLCLAPLVQSAPARGPSAAAIASAHPLATEAGIEVLAAGGNAFDAALAVTAALAVVEPYASGLGGGGFWLLRRASDGYTVVVDGRETAPAAASRAMYRGGPPRASIDGPLAAAIPGVPAGLDHLAARYGRLPLARSLAPAIRLAREGFAVTPRYREMAQLRLEALRRSPAAAAAFLKAGEPPPLGHLIVQPDLARTLEAIATKGSAAFYRGELAGRLARSVRASGGIWAPSDLAGYRVIERRPLVGDYRGVRITTVPPPSAGGVILIESLNILERDDLGRLDRGARAHLIIEAWRHAYRDRARHLGDPDFTAIPLARLLSKDYAKRLHTKIRLERAGVSEGREAHPTRPESRNTTHLSVSDCEGNRVAATLSINYPFGSGFMVEGTGVLLNDEMDDFSTAPWVPNIYGLVSAEVNAIGPGKRPLSSMAPSFLEQGGRVAILGTPGGSRIPSMMVLAAIEFAAGHGPARWVSRPRFHHQYLPDEVRFEPGALSPLEQAGLRRRGHRLASPVKPYGNMQAVLLELDAGIAKAASDGRGEGSARVSPASPCPRPRRSGRAADAGVGRS